MKKVIFIVLAAGLSYFDYSIGQCTMFSIKGDEIYEACNSNKSVSRPGTIDIAPKELCSQIKEEMCSIWNENRGEWSPQNNYSTSLTYIISLFLSKNLNFNLPNNNHLLEILKKDMKKIGNHRSENKYFKKTWSIHKPWLDEFEETLSNLKL